MKSKFHCISSCFNSNIELSYMEIELLLNLLKIFHFTLTNNNNNTHPNSDGKWLENGRPLWIFHWHRSHPVEVFGDVMICKINGTFSLKKKNIRFIVIFLSIS